MECRPPLGDIPLVYTAGPYHSDDPDKRIRKASVIANIRLAEDAGYEIYKMGAVPVIPHKMFSMWDYKYEIDDATILDYTSAILERCDAILMLPGWKQSCGSGKEMEFAKKNGIAVFFSLVKLDEWLEEVM